MFGSTDQIPSLIEVDLMLFSFSLSLSLSPPPPLPPVSRVYSNLRSSYFRKRKKGVN